MRSGSEIEEELRGLKPVLADKFNVRSIGYFGSYATGSQTSNSDLDLLVEFSKTPGWEFFTLEPFLEKTLGIRVDLVTNNALKERIKQSVLNQVRYI